MTVHPRRTALVAALALGLLAAPASAVVLGPSEGLARLLPTTEVGPRPLALAASEEDPPLDPAKGRALGRRVSAALSAAGATTVAAAVDVEGYGAVLRREAAHPLPPASTQKSFVAVSALVALSPSARFRTEVAATATPVAGRLPGHVWLVAGGDPYLTNTQLRALARRVKAAGITTVAGDVLLDDSRYDARRTAAGWKRSYMPGESGPLSAFAVDRNRGRTDRAFLADPALQNAVRFRDHLRAEGVKVGTVRRDRRPAGAATVAVQESGPVSAVVRRVLKDSDNFAAELLLKEVGRVVRGEGSSAAGLTAVRQVLGPLGVRVGAGADGSGLSSQDRQHATAQLELLAAAADAATGPAFRAALPVGCVDGTLKRRFCGTAAAGRVAAKTGTLSGVRALAGYTATASGREVRFAFQLTGVKDGARALKAIDRAVVLLASATE